MRKNSIIIISLSFLLILVSFSPPVSDKKVTHIVNNPWDLSATIKIPDFHDSIKIMQITDIHISIDDESEAEFRQYGERMQSAYTAPRKHYSKDLEKTTLEYFDDILLKAKEEDIELLLLTGDIVNFPSAVSVKYVYDRLMKTGIPWLFIAGNHDWHYEEMPGTLDSLRLTWSKKSLTPFYNGHEPLYYSDVKNGINFVGIDNSTSIITDDQISFLIDQVEREEPIILISHIPYNLNSGASQPGMTKLIDVILSNSDKIIAILAGHIHRTSYYFIGNLCQYTSIASFQGASFIVNVIPE